MTNTRNIWKREHYYKWWAINRWFPAFLRKFKYSYQRIVRGYCDFDVWYLGDYMTELLAATLEHLRVTVHGYPGYEPFDTPEKWDEFLKQAAADLDESLRLTEDAETIEEADKAKEKRNEVFMRIMPYWDNLWD